MVAGRELLWVLRGAQGPARMAVSDATHSGVACVPEPACIRRALVGLAGVDVLGAIPLATPL